MLVIASPLLYKSCGHINPNKTLKANKKRGKCKMIQKKMWYKW